MTAQMKWKIFPGAFLFLTQPHLVLHSFPFPYPLALQCTHPVWSRALFLGIFDPTELNLGELKMVTEGHKATPGHYWGHSQWNVTVTLSGFTWDPWGRGSFRLKNPSCGSCPVVFHGADKCPVTQLLSWKGFQDKLLRLNDDKCWGHKRCYSQILFPTFLALSYGLNLNTQAVRRPKLFSSLCLTFSFQGWAQHKWFVRTVLPKPVHHCCSKFLLSFCTWPRWYTQKSSQFSIIGFIHARNNS